MMDQKAMDQMVEYNMTQMAEDAIRQMAKSAKKQVIRMVLPIIIGVGVILFIIGFILGAIIF